MNIKILIIEKDINISHSLQTQFLIVGMDVLLMSGNDRDIETISDNVIKYSPNYIIIDLALQNFDSFELVDLIKRANINAKIFTYTKMNKELLEKCKKHKIDYVLSTDELTLNQFSIKAIKTIKNQEKLKNKNEKIN